MSERLVKRLVAQELTLSFVPDAEQRLWRTVMRRQVPITRNRVQLRNRLESLLKKAHIKLTSLVSDLLGTSARRMLQGPRRWRDGPDNPGVAGSPAPPRDGRYPLRITRPPVGRRASGFVQLIVD
jgi:hypothetical protein